MSTNPVAGKYPKQRVNLSIREDFLDQAKKAKINLSRVLEESLQARLQLEHQRRWLEENREGIAEYNAYVEKYGCFSDSFRNF